MAISLKPSHEPIAYIGAGIIILQVIRSVINHEPISETTIEAVITAVGSIFGRALVTPNAKQVEK